uniref:Frizzled 1 n=1 Tax=Corallium rubrum TaxID=142104 RepID=A0A0B5AGE3_9CNID|nr:frizzled 1 [Corallium rubrum]
MAPDREDSSRVFLLRFLLFVHAFATVSCQHKCQTLTIKPCMGLNYNRTLFPNFAKHRTQSAAAIVMNQLNPLFNVQCSPDLAYFVCSYYAPVCNTLGRLLPPCRSLCESARKDCLEVVTKFGYKWPPQLNCDKFPSNPKLDLCVGKNDSASPTKPTRTKSPNDQPKSTSEQPIIVNDKLVCPPDQRAPNDQHTFMGQEDCAAPCKNIYFTDEEIKISRIWSGFWSTVCAASTVFTLLTFFIDMSRFRYPERPIIFLSGCYFMVSVAFISGFLAGDDIACNKPVEDGLSRTLTQGTKNEGCTVVFMLIYFFYMAASIWWVVLTLTWFLAAGLKWGHEAIENNYQFFHLAAWVIPAVKTIAVLVLTEVDGDELTGVCFVGLSSEVALRGFVLGPLFVYFFIGTFFLLSGFISLFRVRSVLKNDGDKREKIEKLMIRIGVFSILYMVPAVTVLGCLFYEQANRNKWRESWLDAYQYRSTRCMEVKDASACPPIVPDVKPDFAVLLVKYLMFLIVGITSGFWVWSTKTLGSWRRLYTRLKTSKADNVSS